jgi:hypothetical protein
MPEFVTAGNPTDDQAEVLFRLVRRSRRDAQAKQIQGHTARNRDLGITSLAAANASRSRSATRRTASPEQ